jgi:hypothetical protein
MKFQISIFLALVLNFYHIDTSHSFAPNRIQIQTASASSSILRMKKRDNTNVNANDNMNTNPILSPREARLNIPISTLVSSLLLTTTVGAVAVTAPSPAYAKQSSPQFEQSIRQYFPGSIPTTTVILRVQSTLRKRQYLPYNIHLATSLPREEILFTPISLISQLRNKLSEAKDGGVYALGGLAGIPFAGDAGMGDFLSHSPKDGKIVILFGPHVGIDKLGSLGKVERIGSEEYGADEASGVVVRAYYDIMNGKSSVGGNSGMNLEEDYVVGLLKKMPLKEWKAEGGDDYAIAKLTTEHYKIIQEMVVKQVEGYIAKQGSGFWDRVTEVTMLGGIVVNRGHGSGTEGGDDYFQPLTMKSLVKGTEVNLYGEVFGDLSTPRL